MTIFVTTHYMDEAEYCDRLGLIYRGELIACGTPEALKREVDAGRRAGGGLRPGGSGHGSDRSGCPAVKEVALFGNVLHVVAPDGAEAAAAVRRLLAERGHRVEADREDRPLAGRRFRIADRGPRPRRAAAAGGAAMNLRRVWAVARKELLHMRARPAQPG